MRDQYRFESGISSQLKYAKSEFQSFSAVKSHSSRHTVKLQLSNRYTNCQSFTLSA